MLGGIIQAVSGRPWAIDPRIAEQVRSLVLRDGIGGLRTLAELRSAMRPRAMEDEDYGSSPRAAARGGNVRAGVAIVPVLGAMLQRGGFDGETCEAFESTDAVAARVEAFASDAAVDAIVMEFDSPGGEVFGGPEAWTKIREAGKKKPVVAAVNSMAASLAYWLATAAEEIVVTPSGLVGSVGVYSLHVDASKALEEAGMKWTFISAGKYKVEGHPAEPLGDEARGALQAEVDRYYAMFTSSVAKGRGVPVDDVRSGFGEGRLVGAAAAVEAKMADSVGTLDDAVRRAAKLARDRRDGQGASALGLAQLGEC